MTETHPQHGLSVVVGDRRTTFFLAGEIDIANADEVATAVRAELARRPVLLDMSGLSFIDSCGLRMLVALVRDARGSGRSLTIGRDMSSVATRLFEIVGMLDMLPLDRGGGI